MKFYSIISKYKSYFERFHDVVVLLAECFELIRLVAEAPLGIVLLVSRRVQFHAQTVDNSVVF